MVGSLLRLEGVAVFLAATGYYFWGADGSLLLFVLLLFVPDISMIGYLKGPKLGAITYNVVHTYVAPIVLLVIGAVVNNALIGLLGLILLAHLGLDRALGFGLKYTTEFKDTHLQRV